MFCLFRLDKALLARRDSHQSYLEPLPVQNTATAEQQIGKAQSSSFLDNSDILDEHLAVRRDNGSSDNESEGDESFYGKTCIAIKINICVRTILLFRVLVCCFVNHLIKQGYNICLFLSKSKTCELSLDNQ